MDQLVVASNMIKRTTSTNKKREKETIIHYPKIFINYNDNFTAFSISFAIQGFNKSQVDYTYNLSALLYRYTGTPYVLSNFTIKNGYEVYSYNLTTRLIVENKNYSCFVDHKMILITETISWDYVNRPHALITGQTGAGKTYFMYFLMCCFQYIGSEINVIDPKRSDLFIYSQRMQWRTESQALKSIGLLRETVQKMEDRYLLMEKNYKQGADYRDHKFKPVIVIIDELAALMAQFDSKTSKEFEGYLTQIILKGRQAGVYAVIGLQRPDANIISGNLRDQLSLRVMLGKNSFEGYKMMFEKSLSPLNSELKGSGYLQIQADVIQFLAPYVKITMPPDETVVR